jgi:hypothetical protein
MVHSRPPIDAATSLAERNRTMAYRHMVARLRLVGNEVVARVCAFSGNRPFLLGPQAVKCATVLMVAHGCARSRLVDFGMVARWLRRGCAAVPSLFHQPCHRFVASDTVCRNEGKLVFGEQRALGIWFVVGLDQANLHAFRAPVFDSGGWLAEHLGIARDDSTMQGIEELQGEWRDFTRALIDGGAFPALVD